MSDKKKTISIDVLQRIVKLELKDFKLAILENKQIESIKKEKITFELNVNFNIAEKNKIIEIVLLTKIFSDQTKSLNIGELNSELVVEVSNLEDILKVHKVFPMQVMASFVGVLVSATRGFIILKAKDTIIEGSILPIINPTVFFTQESQVKK
jgi:hypothetical protein